MPLSQAIGHPRLHIERFEGHPAIAFEAGLPMESIEGFSLRQFSDLSMYFGGVQAALWHPTDGLSAVADPRRTGGVAWQAH
jgi:gamma-glutamyltranspeptidase/glutathione hydrolase